MRTVVGLALSLSLCVGIHAQAHSAKSGHKHAEQKHSNKHKDKHKHHKPEPKSKLPNPSKITSVKVKINKVWGLIEQKRGYDWIQLSSNPISSDLIPLSQNAISLFPNGQLKKGKYKAIYLDIDKNLTAVAEGKNYPLKVHNILKPGLWFKGSFEIKTGKIQIMSFDFSSAKDIHIHSNDHYALKPIFKIKKIQEIPNNQDTTPPSINIVSPNISPTKVREQNILIQYADPNIDPNTLSVMIDGVESQLLFVKTVSSAQATLLFLDGLHTIQASVADSFGNRSQVVARNFAIDSTGPLLSISQPLAGSLHDPGPIAFSGSSNEGLSSLTVNGQNISVSANTLNFSGSIQATSSGTVTLNFVALDVLGNSSTKSVNIEIRDISQPQLPPDPATMAPPLSQTSIDPFSQTVSFLYSGSNPIQTGVVPDSIQEYRATVVRGQILKEDGSPLSGAKVTVLNHPELGQTISRADGKYDLVVNGGGKITLHFSKETYISTQRSVETPWNDYRTLESVMMIGYDSKVTSVDLTSPNVQVAKGSTMSDASGPRTGTILIKPQTTARLKMPSGSTQAISNFNLRMTEFTVGENGPMRMPGPLPTTVAYTYAVEISADEAIPKQASVEFDQPVYYYLENFINTPVGGAVPSGYYNYDLGKWIPSENGRVIQILRVESGRAVLDVQGNGGDASNADLTQLGFDSAELTTLAQNYAVGSTLWRIPLKHFSAYDFNMALHKLADIQPPTPPQDDNSNPSCPSLPGSVIDITNQIFNESIPVAGTDLRMMYHSQRSPGFFEKNTILIPLTKDMPPELRKVHLHIEIAGQVHDRIFESPSSQLTTSFTWDGNDAYGRKILGSRIANIRITYLLMAPYVWADPIIEYVFGQITQNATRTYAQTRTSLVYPIEFNVELGGFENNPNSIGHWNLSELHMLNPYTGTLYLGSGETLEAQSRSVEDFAGNPSATSLGDNGPAKNARIVVPNSIAYAPDGSIYITDTGQFRVRKVDPKGAITTIAGTGIQRIGNPVDGGLATETNINHPMSIAINSLGEVFFSEDSFIRKIDRNGVITTILKREDGIYDQDVPATNALVGTILDIAFDSNDYLYLAHSNSGQGRISYIDEIGYIRRYAGSSSGSDAEGISPLQANIQLPFGIDFGPNDDLYYSESARGTVRRIRGNAVNTVAGNPTGIDPKFTNIALEAKFRRPQPVIANDDGSFYFGDADLNAIFLVSNEGRFQRIAGCENCSDFTSNSAMQRAVFSPRDLVRDSLNNLYVLLSNNTVPILKIAESLRSNNFRSSETPVISEDGSEVYVFNISGRHLRTMFSDLGTIKYQFNYDNSGRLIQVVDAVGRITEIRRDSSGQATEIVSPDGLRSRLDISNGNLQSLQLPDGYSYDLTYDNDDRLTAFKKPNGATSTFEYHNTGKLKKDTNALGGFTSLNLETLESWNNFQVSIENAENRMSLISYNRTSEGTETKKYTQSSGLETTYSNSFDGDSKISNSAGISSTASFKGDPRFPLQSKYISKSETLLPSGLRNLATVERQVTFVGPDNTINASTITDTTNVNGSVFLSRFTKSNNFYEFTSPLNKKSGVQVDNANRPILFMTSGIESTSLTYNNRAKLESITQGDRVSQISYDNNGHLNTITNPMNQTTSFTNDIMGRVLAQTFPDGREVHFTYDANGNVTSITPPGRPSHSFVLDLLGSLRQYVPPSLSGNTVTTYQYNLNKEVTSIARPDGRNISFNYAPSTGLLSQIQASNGSYNFTYKPKTELVSGVLSPDGVQTGYSYDGNLPIQKTYSSPLSANVQVTYNSNFQVNTEYINGQGLQNTYDVDGNLTRVGSLIVRPRSDNNLIQYTQLVSAVTNFQYNSFGEVTMITSPSYSANIGQRDALGRITRKVETIQGSTSDYSYTYDTSGRLTHVYLNGSLLRQYGYDLNSNRVSLTSSSGNRSATYDAQDRLLTYSGNTYSYSQNGEISSKILGSNQWSYSYDDFGQLKRVTMPDGTVIDYIIDGEGQRVAKKRNGVIERSFVYSTTGRLIAELDSSGNIVSRFIYATKAHSPDYMVKNGVEYKMIHDQLGSIKLVVTSSGSVVQRIDYDEFGQVLSDSNPNFQPFGFAGGLYDSDTKLVRFGARDYDPETGRWTSKDPILFGGGDSNLYGYVMQDPVNFIDPNGLWTFASEYGTSGNGLSIRITRIEDLVDRAFRNAAGRDAIVTFSTNGRHSINSLHYGGNAIDLRTRDLNRDQINKILNELQRTLGPDYDTLFEGDHLHIEYDKKRKEKCP